MCTSRQLDELETSGKQLESVIYPANKDGSRKGVHSQRNQIDCML